MTARHCATCTCTDDGVPQPATSSPGIRALAKQATAEAVRAAREKTKRDLAERERARATADPNGVTR